VPRIIVCRRNKARRHGSGKGLVSLADGGPRLHSFPPPTLQREHPYRTSTKSGEKAQKVMRSQPFPHISSSIVVVKRLATCFAFLKCLTVLERLDWLLIILPCLWNMAIVVNYMSPLCKHIISLLLIFSNLYYCLFCKLTCSSLFEQASTHSFLRRLDLYFWQCWRSLCKTNCYQGLIILCKDEDFVVIRFVLCCGIRCPHRPEWGRWLLYRLDSCWW